MAREKKKKEKVQSTETTKSATKKSASKGTLTGYDHIEVGDVVGAWVSPTEWASAQPAGYRIQVDNGLNASGWWNNINIITTDRGFEVALAAIVAWHNKRAATELFASAKSWVSYWEDHPEVEKRTEKYLVDSIKSNVKRNS